MTQQTHDDAETFFSGGGTTSAKFTNIGDWVQGEIVSYRQTQQTDISAVPGQPGKPKTWENGDPMYQLVVVLRTAVRDPSIEGDTGERAIYVKGSMKPETQSMAAAIKQAVAEAGAPTIKPGGFLTVQYIGDGPKTGPLSAPKLYRATYQPPADAAAQFIGQPPAVAQPPAQPVQAPPPAPPLTAPPQLAPPAMVPGTVPLPGLTGIPTAPPVQPPPPAQPAGPVDQTVVQAAAAMIRQGMTDEVIRSAFPQLPPETLQAVRNSIAAGLA